nr:hypothetical protein [Tanacetum cinerariifolium]
SNEGVSKPVTSSNIAAPPVTQSRSGSPKESALGVVNLKNAEPVVENGATDVPDVVQPVDFGIKLVPITLCRASEVDHKSVSPFFERRLSDANALSSSPKATDTLSDNNFDEHEMFENMDLGTTVSVDEDSEADSDFQKQHNFDSLPFATTPFCWESKYQYSSPTGKLWERSIQYYSVWV